ncbi:hypothetical protein [Flavobacterium sp.]|uniref:hypothetical protein n=1 Tax=Flavobacterium sp. TaxID=239 RepID=UPI002FDDF927
MKIAFEVLSIFFISILFLLNISNRKAVKYNENNKEISNDIQHNFSKEIDYKATPIIIVKRD